MWPVVLGIGALAGIAVLLNSEAQSNHRAYVSARDDLRRETRRQLELTQQHMARNQFRQDFHAKIKQHYASVQTANQAYTLYRQGLSVVRALQEQLHLSGKTIGELKQKRDQHHGAERAQWRQALQAQRDKHQQLQALITQYKDDTAQFYDDLRKLNQATRALKEDIRDNTGTLGREWYARMQLRQQAHQLT